MEGGDESGVLCAEGVGRRGRGRKLRRAREGDGRVKGMRWSVRWGEGEVGGGVEEVVRSRRGR